MQGPCIGCAAPCREMDDYICEKVLEAKKQAVIKFEIPGEPTGKARPRVTRFGTHNTPQTINYENLVKVLCPKGQKISRPAHVELNVTAYYGIPDSDSKKLKVLKATNAIRPTKKPDCDNVLKIIADALNTIAYDDDSQIVRATVEKYYSTTPRVYVEISEHTY